MNNSVHTIIIVVGMSGVLVVLLTLSYRIYQVLTVLLQSAWLKKHGQQVNAQVTSITEIKGLYVIIYVATAVWTDPKTNAIYTFEGKVGMRNNGNIPVTAAWTEPKTYTFEGRCLAGCWLPYREGHTIAILIDSENPKRYTMKIAC